MTTLTQKQLAEKFQNMHTSNKIVVLPNAWDAGGAVIFEKEGFEAIGTTSAGISYSLGYSDGEFISIDDVLDTTKKIQKRISVPLSVDIERGYANTKEEIIKNIKAVINEGAVGINIEDGICNSKELSSLESQCELIKEMVKLKKELDINFVINARTDAFWLEIGDNKEERLSQSIKRANAYLKAGADCAFVPGALGIGDIEILVQHINGPLNIIATPASPSVTELEKRGVARVSLGSGVVRASLAVIKSISAQVKNEGTFDNMYKTTIAYDKANYLFR